MLSTTSVYGSFEKKFIVNISFSVECKVIMVVLSDSLSCILHESNTIFYANMI